MSLLQLLSVSHSFKETTDRPGTYRLGTRHMLPPFEGMRNTVSHREPARTVHTAAESEPSPFSELVAAPEQRRRLAARHDMMNSDTAKPLSPWLTRRSNLLANEESVSEVRTPAVNARISAKPRMETSAAPALVPPVAKAKVERAPDLKKSELKSPMREAPHEARPQTKQFSAHAAGLPLPITPMHRPKTSWFGKLMDYFSGGRNKKVTSYQYQGGLSLESVRVVRNDLSDSDVDIVSKKNKEAGSTSHSGTEGSQKKGWKGLSARVFQRNKNVFEGKAPREEQGELISKP